MKRARRAARRVVGQGDEHWCRAVMNRAIRAKLDQLGTGSLSALEISGSAHAGRSWAQYRSVHFPEFDLCDVPPATERWDVVICEQVLEHVIDPMGAARNLFALCRPGGLAVVSTPFLIKLHNYPADYWRFSPDGLRVLLDTAGFSPVQVDAWGNRGCVRRNLRTFVPRRRWSSLRNHADVPLVVWAFARRPRGAPDES